MISNGYNETRVLAVLRTRIGWEQPFDPEQPVVDEDNSRSDSGRHYGDFHPSVTIPAINDVLAEPALTDEQLNTVLSRMKDSAIMAALNAVFKSPQLIDSTALLYRSIYNYQPQLQPNTGMFVGQMITVAPGNYTAQVTRVALYFNRDVSFKLYLFAEHNPVAVKQFDVVAVANKQTFVTLDGCFVDGNDEARYFLGYFQQDLDNAMAMNVADVPTASFKIVGVSGFQAPCNHEQNSVEVQRSSYSYESYGLNLEIATYRDFTNVIVSNVHLFDELQGLQMAINVLSGFIFSTRSNGSERINKENAMMYFRDLNTAIPTQNEPFEPGLKSMYKAELKRINATLFPKAKATSVDISCGRSNYR